jgi:hypothetical protein
VYLHPQGGLISVRFLSIHGWLDSTYSPKPKGNVEEIRHAGMII